MSLNELVNMYNQKLNSNGGQSTMAAGPSYHTPLSTFAGNNQFNLGADMANTALYNQGGSFTDNATSTLLFEADSYRFNLNDRVLAGEIIQPLSHNPPRIERIKQADTVVFSTGDTEIEDYEHNEEYTKKYPDIKPELNIVSAQKAKIPPVDMFTNPGEQVQRLIHQGKLKNLHGYVKYPYNYVEPPWHFSSLEEQQGYVNLNPPRSHLTAKDIELNLVDDAHELELPPGVPQGAVSQDRYELIPLPKMVYENFVPLVATRRIVYRRQTSERVSGEAPFQQLPNSSTVASQLPAVEEMTFRV